jgi:hypothetical protein
MGSRAGCKLDQESRNQEADDLVQVISSRYDSSRNAPLPRADGSTEKTSFLKIVILAPLS